MKKYIGKKTGRGLILFCVSIAALMMVVGTYGFYFSNSELIPYIALMVLVISFAPISLAFFIYFFMKKEI